MIIQEGSNGEIYNMAIRGSNLGGSDGIDISGTSLKRILPIPSR